MKNLAEFNRLKKIQNYLEKNDDLTKFLTKYDDDFGVLEYKTQLEKFRQLDCELLQKTLCDIFKGLEINRNALENREVDDLRLFKNSMIEIQDKLHNIHTKLKRDLLKLQDLENNISTELEPYKERFEEWSQPIKKTPACYKNTTKPKERTTKEVQEFHDFVARNGGHYNCWSVDDHQLFLKMRQKYKNIEQIIENLQKILPDKTVDNIHDHENWYRNYDILKNRMKDSLKDWRENRNKNRSPKTTDSDDNNNKIMKNCSSFKQNDEDVKMKIALWKMEKQAKRQQELEMETIKRNQLKQKELNKRCRNEMIKESIKQRKQIKENQQKQEHLKQEEIEFNLKRHKAMAANEMIKKFQTQDDLYIKRRRNSRKNDEKIVKRSTSSHTADRDPERIFKPTQQWLRKIAKHDNYIDNIPNIHRISKLKIPEWRRNI